MILYSRSENSFSDTPPMRIWTAEMRPYGQFEVIEHEEYKVLEKWYRILTSEDIRVLHDMDAEEPGDNLG